MRRSTTLLCLLTLLTGSLTAPLIATGEAEPARLENPLVTLTTVALRVHRMEAMVAFYEEAFGARFREVDTSGLRSQFGEFAGITLKLVPLRDSVDFEDYPSHQLGFEVPNVEAVIMMAIEHGGRQEGELIRDGKWIRGAVRDPDGNTIELYGTR